jgi:hypothetical protein
MRPTMFAPKHPPAQVVATLPDGLRSRLRLLGAFARDVNAACNCLELRNLNCQNGRWAVPQCSKKKCRGTPKTTWLSYPQPAC